MKSQAKIGPGIDNEQVSNKLSKLLITQCVTDLLSYLCIRVRFFFTNYTDDHLKLRTYLYDELLLLLDFVLDQNTLINSDIYF